jgi:hypothetical protein
LLISTIGTQPDNVVRRQITRPLLIGNASACAARGVLGLEIQQSRTPKPLGNQYVVYRFFPAYLSAPAGTTYIGNTNDHQRGGSV